jgi:hypothetical protein
VTSPDERPGGDGFTSERFAWLKQVAADRSLPPRALHVALCIVLHLNRKTGDAWPSHDRIAEMLGLTPRATKRLVGQLSATGHLGLCRGGGRGHSNRYRLQMVTPETPFNGDARDTLSTINGDAGDTLSMRKGDAQRPETVTPASPELFEEHSEKKDTPTGAAGAAPPGRKKPPEATPAMGAEVLPTQKADLYRRGKEVLGASAAGLITNLLRVKNNSVPQARIAIEQASMAENPREYIGRIVAGPSAEDRKRRLAF